ncbi:hypothetical protein COW36_15190 [bacterium (Candidatus Blackallbacteria) CG17_big_fil_post_rev_8_21_14_2_50_48_46]|uniref:Porin n=1 Tax=bacterium (Candidatus Blackallbacteria) CG17_big_fil_post_rev_8_21_14_2_50_48_46 TaxID=2014261 RepID=A0A2M7G2U8_9BACT|nr:MAG: hypothetical protein COW64_11360 [bacterium (Candidatus Blackallbacteria) CG18_big_fil_WC_8_21_14_2_50_49_26]PIW16055.1 MAG: hypothetical protein COW36_15190 [bacterium (Candidatus Blackallbacteria) CG17_big_fil_post_rev_8_21_14_2_50_48_46]PIW50467.1 MAG: hypothetical protein COW20_02905 [bacterium (Candidatus Blackallbacteria) CG13_big_fil_rev_8_21_14_2_50_49_14]
MKIPKQIKRKRHPITFKTLSLLLMPLLYQCLSYPAHAELSRPDENSTPPGIDRTFLSLDGFSFQAPALNADLPAMSNPQNLPIHQSESLNNAWGIETSGFVRFDAFYDTRQTVGGREGLINLYPAAVKTNSSGKDENSDPMLNFLSIFTRGAIKINSPEVWGAKVSGLVEADFFGHLNSTISNLRLRHAYMKMKWDSAELLLGQYWDPLTNIDVFPGIIAVGAGRPVQPFSRNPMIQVKYNPWQAFQLTGALSMQRDAFSETDGNALQERSGLPAATLNAAYHFGQGQIGAGIHGKAIRPAAGAENLYSGAGQIFAKLKPFDKFTLQAKAVMGTDMADHQMVGGYALTKQNSYVNLATVATWLDLDYYLNDLIQLGLYGGYTSNLGTLGTQAEADKFFARDPNQAHSFHIMPRITLHPTKQLQFSLEADWGRALYASTYSASLQPQVQSSDAWVDNFRIGFTSMLKF